MGSGGSVGSDGVLLGIGVGVGRSDGTGAVGALVAGGAVGPGVGATDGAADGAADGVDVRGSGVVGGLAEAGTPDASGCVDALVGLASGDGGVVVEESPATGKMPVSRVRLNPARTRPTASDGPRRTYSVKEARPRWPGAGSFEFPSSAPTPGRQFLPCPQAG